jgi:hypothetical protein
VLVRVTLGEPQEWFDSWIGMIDFVAPEQGIKDVDRGPRHVGIRKKLLDPVERLRMPNLRDEADGLGGPVAARPCTLRRPDP